MEGGEGSHERGRTDPTYHYRCSLVLIPNQNQSAAGVRERTRAIQITAQALHTHLTPVLYSVPSLNWDT